MKKIFVKRLLAFLACADLCMFLFGAFISKTNRSAYVHWSVPVGLVILGAIVVCSVIILFWDDFSNDPPER